MPKNNSRKRRDRWWNLAIGKTIKISKKWLAECCNATGPEGGRWKGIFLSMWGRDGIEHRRLPSWKSNMIRRRICGVWVASYTSWFCTPWRRTSISNTRISKRWGTFSKADPASHCLRAKPPIILNPGRTTRSGKLIKWRSYWRRWARNRILTSVS